MATNGGGMRATAVLIICMALLSCTGKKADVDERFSSPKKVYALWLEASLKGDIPATMEYQTRASQKFMDMQAKNRDIFIGKMVQAAAVFNSYSITDERVSGERAVVVIRNAKSGDAITVPFRYEEGGWKVDLIAMFGG